MWAILGHGCVGSGIGWKESWAPADPSRSEGGMGQEQNPLKVKGTQCRPASSHGVLEVEVITESGKFSQAASRGSSCTG